ncbi:unnamed protein product, partial [Hapterophycus canaliculatus]
LRPSQARLSQLESEAEELKAAEQAAIARSEHVKGKLKELIPMYKEMRDSARESDANAERFEAAASAAEEEVGRLQQQLDAAREEISATRSVVDAGDSRVVALSEEVQALRLSRNRLDQRREELQLELAGWKLKEAFGVGKSGLGLGAAWGAGGAGGDGSTAVMGEVFQRWRLAFLERRQGDLRSESEANREKAEGYESLVQRLSEELERQGEAVNTHASLLRKRDEQLDDALDRAARAHDELISMEPPSLSQAVWCLVRYAIPSSQKRPGKATGKEDGEDAGQEGEEEEEEEEEEEGERMGAASTPRGNGLSAGQASAEEDGGETGQQPAAAGEIGADPSPSVPKSEASDGEAVSTAAEPAQSSPQDPPAPTEGQEEDSDEDGSEDEEDGDERSEASPAEGGGGGGSNEIDTIEVVEWRPQEDVDEWFAAQLAHALEVAEEQQASGGGGGGGGAMDVMAGDGPALAAPVLPVLETPMTLQQSFDAELSRVRGELEGRLEEARAELRRNTEAYKQYRAR